MTKQSYIKATTTIISILLMILWIYAAGSKLTDITDFERGLNNQPFPKEIVRILFFIIPISELSTSVLLVFPKTRLLGFFGSALLLFAFTIYIALILLHVWSYIPCSCGGILQSMGWKTHLIFNLLFLSITIYAFYLNRKEASDTV